MGRGEKRVEMASRGRRRRDRVGRDGMPAAIVAREAGASVIMVEAKPHRRPCHHLAAATCRSAAAPASRRNTASRIRRICSSAISPIGRWSSPTASRLIATTTARSSAPSPTTASPPSNSCWRMASRSSTGARRASATRSAIRCRAPCRSRRATGRWCRPASRPIRAIQESRAGTGLMRPLEAAARKAGVEILLEHRMTAIHRESAA